MPDAVRDRRADGQRGSADAAVADHLGTCGLEPVVDRLGRIAVAFGDPDATPVVMLSGHLDELGLTVRALDDDGIITMARFPPRPGQPLHDAGTGVRGLRDATIQTLSPGSRRR